MIFDTHAHYDDEAFDGDREEILVHTYDLDAISVNRLSWGLFRDRRPETYGMITR